MGTVTHRDERTRLPAFEYFSLDMSVPLNTKREQTFEEVLEGFPVILSSVIRWVNIPDPIPDPAPSSPPRRHNFVNMTCITLPAN